MEYFIDGKTMTDKFLHTCTGDQRLDVVDAV